MAKAVYSKLDNDGNVTSSIYNAVPNSYDPRTDGDYLLLTFPEEEPNEVFEKKRRDVFFEIEAVSDHLGDQKAAEALNQAVNSLDRNSLTVTGWGSETKVHLVSSGESAVSTSQTLLRSLQARFRVTVKKS